MIVCKTADQRELLRSANRIVAEVLDILRQKVTLGVGVTTAELDAAAEAHIRDCGAVPAFKGYQGFPATVCVSVNEEVVHGIPSDRVLKEGDIVSLDVGTVFEGYFGDSAITVGVGQISESAQQLLDATKESLERAITCMHIGAHVSDIGHAVQQYVEPLGFSVVREFVGHGIGTKLHEAPQVPNYGRPGEGPELREGMVFAIEPMVNAGRPAVRMLDDRWTAVTRDGSLSAHFEHSVAVTADGPDVLSRRASELADSNMLSAPANRAASSQTAHAEVGEGR